MASGSATTGDRRPRGDARSIGRGRARVSDVLALARGERTAQLDPDPAYRAVLRQACATVEAHLRAGRPVYGVTTGVGASVENAIPPRLQPELPANLVRFHGCGTGRILGELEAAAVVAVRLLSLARGHSGVREQVLERLCELLNLRLLPRIPEEGSVGASGDLTPLSYLAALLMGEREATLCGRVLPAAEALAEVGLAPLVLAPKESLSLMNGTSVMTALGCVAVERAERLARLAAAVSALDVEATLGNPEHFDARIFALKPHPGAVRAAAWIRADLEAEGDAPARPVARLQDRYSLRCAPHVVGVMLDAQDLARRTLEIELNGVDDNPLVDGDAILHGGNFYGGPVAFAMDALKSAVAGVADLLDRQLPLLCVPATSGGLPANLVAGGSDEGVVHHGFKAMQITASALCAEALKLTMPAAAFSRSTESHNQDKVSMGTIAARDALRVLELSETIAAIGLLAACQALELRGPAARGRRAAALLAAVRKRVPPLGEDRRMDLDIEAVLALLRAGALPLGSMG